MIHQVDCRLPVLHSYMHVQAKNQVRPCHQLHVFDNILVALVRANLLHTPIGKRMRRRRRQCQPIILSQLHHVAPQLLDLGLGIFDVVTDRSPHLDHRLVQFRLHSLLQQQLALFQDFRVDMRAQVPSGRVYGLIFLFNPDGKSRLHSACRVVPPSSSEQPKGLQ